MDDAALADRLEQARKGLLDLSTRNRLLALPKPGRSRGVVMLADEDADLGRFFNKRPDLEIARSTKISH